jgi:hypothetical protein
VLGGDAALSAAEPGCLPAGFELIEDCAHRLHPSSLSRVAFARVDPA